jgi:hypothetical protein
MPPVTRGASRKFHGFNELHSDVTNCTVGAGFSPHVEAPAAHGDKRAG